MKEEEKGTKIDQEKRETEQKENGDEGGTTKLISVNVIKINVCI